jgi:hypothetical protein
MECSLLEAASSTSELDIQWRQYRFRFISYHGFHTGMKVKCGWMDGWIDRQTDRQTDR